MNTAQNTEKVPVLLFQIQAKDARDCLPSINPSVIEDKTSHGTKRPTLFTKFSKTNFVLENWPHTFVRKWASSVHSIYYWGIPILWRLG